ncbi:MAG: histidinol-phosphate aminotransferase family protein [Deltaproteobacteria bacterium]|nr:histidinol-phosphate aminotransferase family protein [Deltaproteobacteria bacterium]
MMKIRQAILQMKPYTPPLAGRDPERLTLLDFNESLADPGPHVAEALISFIRSGRLRLYPDYGDVLERLGKSWGVPPERLALTNGSDQGIEMVMRAVLEPGCRMILPAPTFAMYAQIARSLEAEVFPVASPPDMAVPAEGMLAALTPQTRMVVLAHPNNPTGALVPGGFLRELLEARPDVTVLVDEAYHEFSGQTFLPWLDRHENLVILRTFSKAFAMPALRLGVVAAHPQVIGELLKIRGPYDVNMMAVVAAQAQLEHPEAWRAYVQHVMKEAKPVVETFLRKKGLPFYASAANFLLIRPPHVKKMVEGLAAQGILVRPQAPPAQDCFRLTIGPLDVMTPVLAAMETCL